jgi:hypothetical protein
MLNVYAYRISDESRPTMFFHPSWIFHMLHCMRRNLGSEVVTGIRESGIQKHKQKTRTRGFASVMGPQIYVQWLSLR